MTKAWQDRVRAEREVLVDRIGRLRAFMGADAPVAWSDAFAALDKVDQELLSSQLDAMDRLRLALDGRIARFGPPGKPPPFHWALHDVLSRYRDDRTVPVETLVVMLVGHIHEFVRRPDVRDRAIARLTEMGGQESWTHEEVYDAVVKAVMEGG